MSTKSRKFQKGLLSTLLLSYSNSKDADKFLIFQEPWINRTLVTWKINKLKYKKIQSLTVLLKKSKILLNNVNSTPMIKQDAECFKRN